eukprot:1155980-Pelagomonas_calceolata.AAC.1
MLSPVRLRGRLEELAAKSGGGCVCARVGRACGGSMLSSRRLFMRGVDGRWDSGRDGEGGLRCEGCRKCAEGLAWCPKRLWGSRVGGARAARQACCCNTASSTWGCPEEDVGWNRGGMTPELKGFPAPPEDAAAAAACRAIEPASSTGKSNTAGMPVVGPLQPPLPLAPLLPLTAAPPPSVPALPPQYAAPPAPPMPSPAPRPWTSLLLLLPPRPWLCCCSTTPGADKWPWRP